MDGDGDCDGCAEQNHLDLGQKQIEVFDQEYGR